MSVAIDSALHRGVAALMERAAREVILPRFRMLAAHEIVEKAPDDLVTVADREAELLLAAGLAELLPQAAIVGEEAVYADVSVMDRLGGLCWIIDPVDGTHNFAHGKPPFGIIVALADAGEAVAGWIYDPLRRRLCHAARGGGAFIDGRPVRARPSGEEPPIAALSMLFMNPDRREAMRRHAAPHYRVVDIPRCAAEQYPRLVLGANDVAIVERTLPWDHAAGVLFLNEAGGRAARLDGSAYRVDDGRRGMIAASDPAIWERMARHLREIEA